MSIFLTAIGNPLMKAILLSPLHPLMSKNMAVLLVTGMRSGKTYSFPVNYQRERNIVWITSMKDRTWWRNLRGGANVTLRIQGKDHKGRGEVFENISDVEEYLGEYFKLNPVYAKYFDVRLDEDGEFVLGDMEKAAGDRVMVRVVLS
jgi:hypothetical protein